MRHISVTDLKRYLEQPNGQPLLLDVREPWEYQICHLENTKLVPMNQIPAALKHLDKNRETIIICHHGVRSYRTGLLLKGCGFSDVVNVTGGISEWAKRVDPNMSTY